MFGERATRMTGSAPANYCSGEPSCGQKHTGAPSTTSEGTRRTRLQVRLGSRKGSEAKSFDLFPPPATCSDLDGTDSCKHSQECGGDGGAARRSRRAQGP